MHDLTQMLRDIEAPTSMKGCFEVTVYWRGSMYDRAAELLGLQRRAIEMTAADAFTHFETGSTSRPRRLGHQHLETLQVWLSQARRPKDIYQLILSRQEDGQRSLPVLHFCSDEEDAVPTGCLRLCLDIDHFRSDHVEAAAAVARLVDGLSLESGHAGIGIAADPCADDAVSVQAAMARISRVAPGVDLHDMDVVMVAFARAAPPVIKRVSWITMLGARMAASVSDDLLTLNGGDYGLQVFNGGIAIRAGVAPALGNGRTLDLPERRAVGRVLRTCRLQGIHSLFGAAVPDAHALTEAWLGHYDQ